MRRMIQRLDQLLNRIRILPARPRLHIIFYIRHLPQPARFDVLRPAAEAPVGDVEAPAVGRRADGERAEVLDAGAVGSQEGDLIDVAEAGAVGLDLDGPDLALAPLAVEDAAAVGRRR